MENAQDSQVESAFDSKAAHTVNHHGTGIQCVRVQPSSLLKS
jgi:hypothetical protein